MNRYFPIYVDLRDKVTVVIGAGAIAERRARHLIDSGAKVRVIAPAYTAAFEAWVNTGEIELWRKEYSIEDLKDALLVVAATDSRYINAQITHDAKGKGLLVNNVSEADEGDVIIPTTVRRGDLCISIATGGNNPALSMRLAGEIERRFSPHYGKFVDLLGEMREHIRVEVHEALRRNAQRSLLDAEAELLELLEADNSEGASQRAKEIVAMVTKG